MCSQGVRTCLTYFERWTTQYHCYVRTQYTSECTETKVNNKEQQRLRWIRQRPNQKDFEMIKILQAAEDTVSAGTPWLIYSGDHHLFTLAHMPPVTWERAGWEVGRWEGGKELMPGWDQGTVRWTLTLNARSQICDLVCVRFSFYLRLCPVSKFANYFHESHDNFTWIQIIPLAFLISLFSH